MSSKSDLNFTLSVPSLFLAHTHTRAHPCTHTHAHSHAHTPTRTHPCLHNALSLSLGHTQTPIHSIFSLILSQIRSPVTTHSVSLSSQFSLCACVPAKELQLYWARHHGVHRVIHFGKKTIIGWNISMVKKWSIRLIFFWSNKSVWMKIWVVNTFKKKKRRRQLKLFPEITIFPC